MQALLSQVPGVYVQGLYCVDATGKVVFEKKLAQIAVEQAMSLAAKCGVSLIAYDGDTIYATESSNAEHLNDIHAKWGEPQPQVLDDASMKQYAPGFHKVLLMGDCADEMSYIRPELEALATSLDCVVTQAIPVMLELLPSGCGKAVGVQQLCAHLGLDLQQNVVAIGDAENDLDLLQQAAIGIAVGNAAPAVKDVADVVLVETNNEGGAGRAIELFGLGKVLDLLKE
jgi:hydroxymethylpyrimidine pyrophosphatase-like HAD family hydrolase